MNADTLLAAGCLVLLAAAIGASLRHRDPAPEQVEPEHGGADESYADELAGIREQLIAEIRAEALPQPGSDEWWQAEWAAVDAVLEEARATFSRNVEAALPPDFAALVRRDESDTAEFWRIVEHAVEPTDEYPIVAGYQRAEVWG